MQTRSLAAYERAKNRLEVPMILLALALGVLLVVPLAMSVSDELETRLDLVGWAIWVVFVIEYLYLLWIAPSRLQMMRDHPLELLLIALPMFRPLRVLRLLPLVLGAGATFKTVSRVVGRKGLQWFLVIAVAIIGLGAVLVFAIERNEAGSQVADLGDALWWAIVTCTTVGYGDIAPITPGGRVVAVALMLLGISIVSVITANIASVMVEEDTESDIDRLETKIDKLSRQIEQLVADASGAEANGR